MGKCNEDLVHYPGSPRLWVSFSNKVTVFFQARLSENVGQAGWLFLSQTHPRTASLSARFSLKQSCESAVGGLHRLEATRTEHEGNRLAYSPIKGTVTAYTFSACRCPYFFVYPFVQIRRAGLYRSRVDSLVYVSD